ncbi:MAG: D-aminoacyl-tRNA deacylase [Desulfobacterales bacterium]
MNNNMRAVIQRVKESSVVVKNRIVGKISAGLLVFLGVSTTDRLQDVEFLSDKIVNLRIFEDQNEKMNRSLLETGGEMLVVSQFTLLGDCRKGRRPSFIHAARPDEADRLYQSFVKRIQEKGIIVQTGRFRARMDVSLINDGPVTLIVESK